MTKPKEEKAKSPAAPACLITGDTRDSGPSGENHKFERSVCASTGTIKGIDKHSTDTGADLGARILHALSKLWWPKLNIGRKCLTNGRHETTSVTQSGRCLELQLWSAVVQGDEVSRRGD